MARKDRKKSAVIKEPEVNRDKGFRRQLSNINNLLGQANLSLYGTDRTSDVDNLNAKFQQLLNNEIGDMTNRSEGDITSFLGQLVSSDGKATAADEILNNQFMAMTGDEYGTMQSFIYDAYRNRLLEQSDLHEVSTLFKLLGASTLEEATTAIALGALTNSFDSRITNNLRTESYYVDLIFDNYGI